MAGNTSTIIRKPHVIEVQDSITRAATTTTYAAADTISDDETTPTTAGYVTFDVAEREGGSVQFIDFTIHKSDNDVSSATFSLLLFTTLPAVAGFKDNLACAITDAEMLECKGIVYISASNWVSVALGNIQTISQNIGMVMAPNSTVVYGVFVAGSAYIPVASEVFTFTAHAIQD